MKAEITFSQLWYNPSILGFFFRSQSEKTLEELMNRTSLSSDAVCDSIDTYADNYEVDLDTIEEMFYNDSIEELAEEFEIELNEEE